jgi:hypothetical protein
MCTYLPSPSLSFSVRACGGVRTDDDDLALAAVIIIAQVTHKVEPLRRTAQHVHVTVWAGAGRTRTRSAWDESRPFH